MGKFKIKGATFVLGATIGGYLSGGNYEFAISALIIFTTLSITKQVEFI
jgi:hypothetical protein